MESLHLHTLSDLETIGSHEKLAAESFGIRVLNCKRLKNLFSVAVAKGLSRLEEITVKNFKRIEEVVVAYGRESDVCNVNTDEVIELRQLRTQSLLNIYQN